MWRNYKAGIVSEGYATGLEEYGRLFAAGKIVVAWSGARNKRALETVGLWLKERGRAVLLM